jgi:hypothetical protein
VTNSRLAFLIAGLVVALLGGFGLGRVTGGDGTGGDGTSGAGVSGAGRAATTTAPGAATDHTHAPGTGPHDHAAGNGTAGNGITGNGATGTGTASAAGGLAVSVSGYTLVPSVTSMPAGRPKDFAFRIVDADQRPVTTFAVVHDKPLHLIVVRRDLSGYQHLHPTMAPDGAWSVPLTLPSAGAWRAYADFTALDAAGKGTAVTLGVDLSVSGDYAARPLPAPANRATVGGFTVEYQGTPRPGATQPMLFRVAGAGALERYLGAYGHLVVLREGDLGYVHVHPEERLVDGAVKFWLAAPSTGRYRMFFDFQVAGRVHTAEFTLTVNP